MWQEIVAQSPSTVPPGQKGPSRGRLGHITATNACRTRDRSRVAGSRHPASLTHERAVRCPFSGMEVRTPVRGVTTATRADDSIGPLTRRLPRHDRAVAQAAEPPVASLSSCIVRLPCGHQARGATRPGTRPVEVGPSLSKADRLLRGPQAEGIPSAKLMRGSRAYLAARSRRGTRHTTGDS